MRSGLTPGAVWLWLFLLAPAASLAAVPAPATPAPGLLLGVGGGVWAPVEVLTPGYRVGAVAQYRLPIAEARLRAVGSAGVQQAAAKFQALVPGRMLDPAFIENVLVAYLELGAEFDLWRSGPHALSAGLAYAASPTFARFHTLGSWTEERVLGHAGAATVAYRLRLGPGEAAVHLRFAYGAAPLGPLGDVGTSSLTALSASFSYCFDLTPGGTAR